MKPATWRLLLLCREERRLPDDQWGNICAMVRDRDRNVCQFRRWLGWGPICGRPAECVDHIRPVALGGSSDPSNCRAACARCNLRKGARPPLGWALGRMARTWGTVAALAYAVTLLPRTEADASAPLGAWAVVVASDGRVVRTFDTRADAERAAAAWDGGRGQLGVRRAGE